MIKLIVVALLCLAGSAKAQTLTTINENLWTTGNWQYFDTATNGASVFGGTVTVQGNAFSVGTASFTVSGGSATVAYGLTVANLGVENASTVVGTETVRGNAFSVGGSGLVVASGNVGIGTASPGTNLEIDGASATSAVLNIRTNGGGNDQSLIFLSSSTTVLWQIGSFNWAAASGEFFVYDNVNAYNALTFVPGSGSSAQAIIENGGGIVRLGTASGTQVYRCSGGTSAGDLCYGNSCSAAVCTTGGGTFVGTGLYLP